MLKSLVISHFITTKIFNVLNNYFYKNCKMTELLITINCNLFLIDLNGIRGNQEEYVSWYIFKNFRMNYHKSVT